LGVIFRAFDYFGVRHLSGMAFCNLVGVLS